MSFLQGYAKRLGVLEYQGLWNATLNEPSLSSGVGQQGSYYIVGTDGESALDGITDWKVGDWLIFNGSVWQKIDTTDEVSLDSPAFTGAPTAPTPDSSDDSYRIATTQFVKQQVAGLASTGFLDGGTPSTIFDSLVEIDGGGV